MKYIGANTMMYCLHELILYTDNEMKHYIDEKSKIGGEKNIQGK